MKGNLLPPFFRIAMPDVQVPQLASYLLKEGESS